MDIYTEYGALKFDVVDQLGDAGEKAFNSFVAQFPNVTLTESRILFHEFITELNCRFAENLLRKALKQKRNSVIA